MYLDGINHWASCTSSGSPRKKAEVILWRRASSPGAGEVIHAPIMKQAGHLQQETPWGKGRGVRRSWQDQGVRRRAWLELQAWLQPARRPESLALSAGQASHPGCLQPLGALGAPGQKAGRRQAGAGAVFLAGGLGGET